MNEAAQKLERRAATKLLLRGFRFREQRDLMAKIGHRSGDPIVVVLDSDTLGDVIGRIVNEQVDPPIVVAMYRPAERGLVIWTFEPAAADAVIEQAQGAGHLATIGMLYDTMLANNCRTMDLVLSAVGRTRMQAAELAPC